MINTVKSTHLWIVLVGFHDLQMFPDRTSRVLSVKVGKHVFGLSLFRPSRQSNPSPRRAHVGRREIQISPPRGEQDWSNALPQGQQRQSNPNPMPCLPLRRLYIDRCIRSSIDLGTWRRFETGQSHDPLRRREERDSKRMRSKKEAPSQVTFLKFLFRFQG